jgi:hypothetical protein
LYVCECGVEKKRERSEQRKKKREERGARNVE